MRILLMVFLIMALLTGARSMPRIEEAGPWVYLRDDKPLSANEGAVEVLAVGDINLARGMAEVADPFAGTAAWLRSADVAIGNLECVVAGTADDGRSTIDEAQEAGRKPYVLIAPSEAAEKLAGAGFDLLGVANNHSLDAGLDGLEVTAEHLKAAGIEPVGAGVGSQASSPVLRT
jgi:poly-gamma-glutamate synthesis protein (capsule biosynthesis protein)